MYTVYGSAGPLPRLKKILSAEKTRPPRGQAFPQGQETPLSLEHTSFAVDFRLFLADYLPSSHDKEKQTHTRRCLV